MLNKWLLSPRTIVLIALVLSLPALFTGYFGDDYMHHALLQENSPVQKPHDLSLFGLFSFVNGDAQRTYELMDFGLLPWWTNPDLKYAFWRPISEITHWIDHALWPNTPMLMHAQNIAWYLLLVTLTYYLFRRINGSLPTIIPVLAMLIYALDSSHGFTISWIANRNSLIAATFGVGALLFYTRWHDEQRFLDYLLSLGLLALSLLSAEFGISTCAYLGAFALFLDRSGPIKGLMNIVPHASLTVLWWIIYKVGNFGAANADAYYLDPIASPLLFLSTLGERLIALIGSQWGIIPAEVYGFVGPGVPMAANVALIVGSSVIVLTLLLLTPILKKHANVRFWFFGMIFSALPVCSAAPHDRVLLFIGLGGTYCTAAIIYSALRLGAETYSTKQSIAKLSAYPFAFIHLILAPLLMPVMAYSTKVWSNQLDLSPATFAGIDSLEGKEIVLFDVPMGSALAITSTRVSKNQPIADKVWVISTTKTDTDITRLSNHELLVSKPTGFVTGPELATRNLETSPIIVGDTIPLNGAVIKVLQVGEQGHPTEVHVRFKKSLDDPDLLLLDWDPATKQYQRITLPTIESSYLLSNASVSQRVNKDEATPLSESLNTELSSNGELATTNK
ncbi:hypothetical protein A9Q99_23190 [Gammaproteobacteria bacterium 45_16_T64]|nr:hypothetical protein A9Q99_23190 [Gammaproteobacteria bacterium 45_16_T64]